jgi:hypothetical protein
MSRIDYPPTEAPLGPRTTAQGSSSGQFRFARPLAAKKIAFLSKMAPEDH